MFRFKDLTLERVNVKLSLNNRITLEGPNSSLVHMAANPLTSHKEFGCISQQALHPVLNCGDAEGQGSHSLTNLQSSSRGVSPQPTADASRSCFLLCLLCAVRPARGFFCSSLSYNLPFIYIASVFSLLFPPYCVDWVSVQCVFHYSHQPGSLQVLPVLRCHFPPAHTRPLRMSRDELQIENPLFESICVSPEGLFVPMQMLCSGNDV